jgi:hypothetical protein
LESLLSVGVLPGGPVHPSRYAFKVFALRIKLRRTIAISAVPYAETELRDLHPRHDKVVFVGTGASPLEEGDDGEEGATVDPRALQGADPPVGPPTSQPPSSQKKWWEVELGMEVASCGAGDPKDASG